jgi:hypothetical protein
MKLICSYIKCYYFGNTFSFVVPVSSRLSYVFQEGYHRKQDLKGLRGSQTSEGVSDPEEARFHDTLSDA